jgi:hypothetical protein
MLASAEFSQGIGDIEEPTREASAKFNEGLASFHLMLAALDRRDLDRAKHFQVQAIEQIETATQIYYDASAKADQHVLKPIAESAQEHADISYFNEHAAAYKVRLPVSQRDLLVATSALVGNFADTLKRANLSELISSLRAQQALFVDSVDLQTFLNSVTTVLTVG